MSSAFLKVVVMARTMLARGGRVARIAQRPARTSFRVETLVNSVILSLPVDAIDGQRVGNEEHIGCCGVCWTLWILTFCFFFSFYIIAAVLSTIEAGSTEAYKSCRFRLTDVQDVASRRLAIATSKRQRCVPSSCYCE